MHAICERGQRGDQDSSLPHETVNNFQIDSHTYKYGVGLVEAVVRQGLFEDQEVM